jgi:hypothetical protein
MAEIVTELDFRIIDEEIKSKISIEPVTSKIMSCVEIKSDWDEIPVEQPSIIDCVKFNSKTPIEGGFDWSRYKSEDAFFDFDDDLLDLDDKNKKLDIEPLYDDGLSYYKNKPTHEHMWGDINKNNVETSLDDLYNMILEVQARVDTINHNVADLSDMIKIQFINMMNKINAIYKKVNNT